MAIAAYFQRSATAASQVLKNFDDEGFIRVLNRHRIGLIIDGSAATSYEGRSTADMVVRLLARFYPKIAILPADEMAIPEAAALRKLALDINPKISVSDRPSGVTHSVVIGKTAFPPTEKRSRTIYAGSTNWISKLSMKKPVGSGASKNPFAAGTAACLAVARVFRIVFAKQLPEGDVEEEVDFSLVTLAKRKRKDKAPGAYRAPDIGRVYLVGAGAIGNGVLWALGRSSAKGEVNVVEPQQLELSNMQRYVMPVMDDVEKSKTALAVKWLAGTRIQVAVHKQPWDEFVRALDEWIFERVLVAVDTAEARIGVQASLPKWIANAYTLGSGIGVSRHHFLGDGACLACLYIPRETATSEDVLVASALGFDSAPGSPELMEVRRRLDRGERCERSFLEVIAKKKGRPLSSLLPFENRPLRDFYRDGVCGGQIIGFNVDDKEVHAEVPMAFQSAMAGILLAAELVLEVAGARDDTFPTVTRLDLCRPLPDVASTRRGKDVKGRCLCQDKDYIRIYTQKYRTEVSS